MKLNRILFSFVVILFSTSCDDHIINRDEDRIYKLTDMKAYVVENSHINTCESDDTTQAINNNEYCKYDKFMIVLNFEKEFVEGGDIGESITEDTIKNIVIISNNDYNENFLKRDTLNDIINIKIHGTATDNEAPPIIYCNNINNYILSKPKAILGGIRLYFTESPLDERLHKFIVSYEEFSGSKFIDTTKAVYIQP
ncbi:MAG: hypothetical protein K8R54_00235 [Bacteroidales bacterium]|nr:hypothetical protein [Bacteroidales bacterium]